MSGDTDLLDEPGHALDGKEGQGERVNGSAGKSPHLELEGFSGRLEHLLFLARAQKLDLARLSLQEFIEQLTGALKREAPINQKAEWVGMATWVILLRSRLLIPVSPAAQQNAEAEAQTLQARLVALQEMQSLAGWLSARPPLGQDVFARGAPEILGALAETDHQLDVIEFLWATIELLDDLDDTDTEPLYQPFYLDIHKVSEARERIFQRVVEAAERQDLQDLVPGLDPADANSVRRYKTGWTTTLTAALEMAKQGEVVLVQKCSFEPISVAKAELALSPCAAWLAARGPSKPACWQPPIQAPVFERLGLGWCSLRRPFGRSACEHPFQSSWQRYTTSCQDPPTRQIAKALGTCQISLKRSCLKLCESSLIVAASSGRVAAIRRHVHTSRA